MYANDRSSAGGLNQYVFRNNNPVNYTDPDGMWKAGVFLEDFLVLL